MNETSLIAICIWWGEEEGTGAVFRPKSLGQVEKHNQTLAKYVTRSCFKQFSSYLICKREETSSFLSRLFFKAFNCKDMKTLDIDINDEALMQIVAKVQIFEIGHLSPGSQIKGLLNDNAKMDSQQLEQISVKNGKFT